MTILKSAFRAILDLVLAELNTFAFHIKMSKEKNKNEKLSIVSGKKYSTTS